MYLSNLLKYLLLPILLAGVIWQLASTWKRLEAEQIPISNKSVEKGAISSLVSNSPILKDQQSVSVPKSSPQQTAFASASSQGAQQKAPSGDSQTAITQIGGPSSSSSFGSVAAPTINPPMSSSGTGVLKSPSTAAPRGTTQNIQTSTGGVQSDAGALSQVNSRSSSSTPSSDTPKSSNTGEGTSQSAGGAAKTGSYIEPSSFIDPQNIQYDIYRQQYGGATWNAWNASTNKM